VKDFGAAKISISPWSPGRQIMLPLHPENILRTESEDHAMKIDRRGQALRMRHLFHVPRDKKHQETVTRIGPAIVLE
jgi:hypothetical protein